MKYGGGEIDADPGAQQMDNADEERNRLNQEIWKKKKKYI